MIVIDSRSFLNGTLLVFVVLFRTLLHPFVILTGVNGGVCAAAPWSVLHRNEARINMVTAFVGQTFEVGTCIFSALFITHVRVLWNSDLESHLQNKGKKNKHYFFFCQVIRWKARNGNMHNYCRKHLQAFTAFRNLGLKTWTLSLQSQYHQSSLAKCITQIERSIIASLLCPHRVN